MNLTDVRSRQIRAAENQALFRDMNDCTSCPGGAPVTGSERSG
jgi:hypothetical protein